ncbi:hypothetical protein D1007_24507 [Hordeum vulgare]|nr:hypothetical protein D1007_24507 [Hordeum vulgare]
MPPVIAEGTSDSRATVMESLRGSREIFLNAAMTAVGPEVLASSVGSSLPNAGYTAQELIRLQPQSDLDSISLGYMAQEVPVRIDVSSTATKSAFVPALYPLDRLVPKSRGAWFRQQPRVCPKPGFPRLGTGRATKVPPHTAMAWLAMAGRGSKQSATSRQPGQHSGQGNPPVAKSLGSTPAQVWSSQAAAHARKPPIGAPGQAKDSTQANRPHRGRWGDEGGNGYSDGHYRGGSSSGGGRGFAWQNNGFSAPPGQFVPGPSGPAYPKRGGFRQNWIGRGGGRKPGPPVPTPEKPADLNDSAVVSTAETAKEVAAPPPADQTLMYSQILILAWEEQQWMDWVTANLLARPCRFRFCRGVLVRPRCCACMLPRQLRRRVLELGVTENLPHHGTTLLVCLFQRFAAAACGGALANAGDAQTGFIPGADQPDVDEV